MFWPRDMHKRWAFAAFGLSSEALVAPGVTLHALCCAGARPELGTRFDRQYYSIPSGSAAGRPSGCVLLAARARSSLRSTLADLPQIQA